MLGGGYVPPVFSVFVIPMPDHQMPDLQIGILKKKIFFRIVILCATKKYEVLFCATIFKSSNTKYYNHNYYGEETIISNNTQLENHMATKRRQAARVANRNFVSDRNVNKLVDGAVNIGTAYTVGMVGIGMLGAIKGSFPPHP